MNASYNLRKQFLSGQLQQDKKIEILSELPINNQFFSTKANDGYLKKLPNSEMNFKKTSDYCYPIIVPFDKIKFSRLYPINSQRDGHLKSIKDPETKLELPTKDCFYGASKNILSNKPSLYSQNDVEEILTKFLDSKKIENNKENLNIDELSMDSSSESLYYTQKDVDAVLNKFLNSKKVNKDGDKDFFDDSSDNYTENAFFSQEFTANDISKDFQDMKITDKELEKNNPSDKLLETFSSNQKISPESSVTDLSKELLDSKTRTKQQKSNSLYFFDYTEDILNKDVLIALQNSKRWDLLKHPFVMNFIDEKLIKKQDYCFNLLFVGLNFLIPLYFATILPPYIFTIIGGVEIISYCMYFFFNMFLTNPNNQLSFTTWFHKINFITTALYTKTLFYTWHFFIYSFKEYNLDTNIFLRNLSKRLFIFLIYFIIFRLIKKSSKDLYNEIVKKTVIFLMKYQKKWFPKIILIIGFLEYLLFLQTGSYYKTFPNFFKAFLWFSYTYLMAFQLSLAFVSIIFCYLFGIEEYDIVKYNFKDTLIKEKLKYCIEFLEMSENCTQLMDICGKYFSPKVPNVLVINGEKKMLYSYYDSAVQIDSITNYHIYTINDLNCVNNVKKKNEIN